MGRNPHRLEERNVVPRLEDTPPHQICKVNLAFDSASVTLKAPVTVARVDANTWTVATEIDAMLSIKDLGFSDPLAALITLCAHQSVDDAVAITANLTFRAAE